MTNNPYRRSERALACVIIPETAASPQAVCSRHKEETLS
jgi:hypothetical protein